MCCQATSPLQRSVICIVFSFLQLDLVWVQGAAQCITVQETCQDQKALPGQMHSGFWVSFCLHPSKLHPRDKKSLGARLKNSITSETKI